MPTYLSKLSYLTISISHLLCHPLYSTADQCLSMAKHNLLYNFFVTEWSWNLFYPWASTIIVLKQHVRYYMHPHRTVFCYIIRSIHNAGLRACNEKISRRYVIKSVTRCVTGYQFRPVFRTSSSGKPRAWITALKRPYSRGNTGSSLRMIFSACVMIQVHCKLWHIRLNGS